MRIRSLSPLLAALALLLTGCPPSGPGSNTVTTNTNTDTSSSKTGTTTSLPVTNATAVQVCEVHCEKGPFMTMPNPALYSSLPLNATESNSLQRAIPGGKNVPDSTHLHATIVKGNLDFTADRDASHAEATTTTLAFPNGSNPARQVKIVATPEAAALIHQRLTASHN